LVDQHRSTLELIDQRATIKRGARTDVGQHGVGGSSALMDHEREGLSVCQFVVTTCSSC
jgi:hypothetical protein